MLWFVAQVDYDYETVESIQPPHPAPLVLMYAQRQNDVIAAIAKIELPLRAVTILQGYGDEATARENYPDVVLW